MSYDAYILFVEIKYFKLKKNEEAFMSIKCGAFIFLHTQRMAPKVGMLAAPNRDRVDWWLPCGSAECRDVTEVACARIGRPSFEHKSGLPT